MGECILTKKILLNTDTYTATSKSASIDMGEFNRYRYLNTSGIPNSNSATYTPTANSSAADMGATNSYRYVNTNTVYNLGKSAGASGLYVVWVASNPAAGQGAFTITFSQNVKNCYVITSIQDSHDGDFPKKTSLSKNVRTQIGTANYRSRYATWNGAKSISVENGTWVPGGAASTVQAVPIIAWGEPA